MGSRNVDDDHMDHDSMYNASPRGSPDKLHTNLNKLMLDGNLDETREGRDNATASSTLNRVNGHLAGSSDAGENPNTTAPAGRKIVQRMQNESWKIGAPAERVPGVAKFKSRAPKKTESGATRNTVRAVARPTPGVNDEDDDLFNVPESPDRLKQSRSANERASKGKKATKSSTKLAVYSAKVATRAPVGSTAKPQAKEVMRVPEPRKYQKAGDTDWDEGLRVNEGEDEPDTVPEKAKSTLSKNASSAKGRKTKNVGNRKSPITAKAGSSKKKKIADSKTAAAKRQSSPVPLNQPRSRRAAAVKANNRIQGIHDEDINSSGSALHPKAGTDELPSEHNTEAEAEPDQAKLQQNQNSDPTKASPVTEGSLRESIHIETPADDRTTGDVNDEAPRVRVTTSLKVHQRGPTNSPEDVALLEQNNTTETPVQAMKIGQLVKDAASADVDGSEKETRGVIMNDEDFEQPIDHYFDDTMASSDEDMDHRLGSVEKAVPVEEAGLADEPDREEPPAGLTIGGRDNEFQQSPNEAPVKTREPIASKLNRALAGLLSAALPTNDLSESKDGLPRASAKFQPRMNETTPKKDPKRIKEVRRTKLDKSLNAGNDDKQGAVYGKVSKTSKQTPGYVAPNILTRSKSPEPAQMARNSGNSQADLRVAVKSNANHTMPKKPKTITISSEDSEESEYFSDEAVEDGVLLTAGDIPVSIPPPLMAPVVVAAKLKHIAAEETAAPPKAVALPKTTAAQGAPESRKRKSMDQDDEARLSKKPRAPLPARFRTPPNEASTKVVREGTSSPPNQLTDDYLHRKSTLISFSARGPRNQGIVSAQKPREPPMTSNDPKKQNLHQKEAVMKRKRDEGTVTAALLVETPEEKRRRRSVVKMPTGTSGPGMLNVSQRLGSQGSRADENGSPRPLVKNPRKSDEWADGILKRLQALEESEIARQQSTENAVNHTMAGRFEVEEADLPRLISELLPDRDGEKIFPSIRKHLPSSPNAPSQIVADLTAHRVQSGGNFVNVETESIVKPSAPQDPFTGSVRQRPNSFMEKLRAPSKLVSGSRSNNPNGRGRTRGLEISTTFAADPDKTFVMMESIYSSPPSIRPDTGSDSSGSPNPSSHMQSTGRGTGYDPERQWRQALQPHQSSQLDILYDISNVSG